ncbi:MAG: response regulator [Azospirillaceae bacterium]|nr:response regulator [Azospirillaceae bacterium]
MRSLTRTSIRLLLPFVLVLALVSTGLGFYLSRLNRDARDWVRDSHRVIDEARLTLLAIERTDSAYRGLVMTDGDPLATSYRDDTAIAAAHLGRLRALIADNAAQETTIDQLDGQIAALVQLMEGSITRHRNGAVILDEDAGIVGKIDARINGIAGTIDEIVETQDRLLVTRDATVDRRQALSISFLIVADVLAGMGMVVAFTMLRRHEGLLQTAEAVAGQAQKMEAVGHLTGGIAHDFNNILQAVITNLDLAIEHSACDPAVAGYLQNALIATGKGARLTAQLLAFARRQPLPPTVIQIDRVVQEITTLLRRTLGEAITIDLVEPEGLWRTKADPGLLQSALLNLALNAKDAMPEGGRLTIEVANVTLDTADAAARHEVTAGPYVMLAVSDTGVGMSPAVVAQAFEPFFTTKAEGTGLGLSMVLGFVKQSGGHIEIDSEVGQGTTVKIYLPRTEEPEAAAPVRQPMPRQGHGETILVVEDEEGVRGGVAAQLVKLGYRPQVAASGVVARDILASAADIDLLFTDVILSGPIDGARLAEEAYRLRPALPVIFTSGDTENAIVHRDRLPDGAILLAKPYRTVDLAAAIADRLALPPVLSADAPPPVAAHIPAAAGANPGPVAASVGGNGVAPVRGSILLVEDEPLIRIATAAYLRAKGHPVDEAPTAAAAIQLVQRGHPVAVMIADLGLPDGNGLDLVATARSVLPDLVVIVTTGQSQLPPEVDDIPGHPVRLLRKPFTVEGLSRVLAELGIIADNGGLPQ